MWRYLVYKRYTLHGWHAHIRHLSLNQSMLYFHHPGHWKILINFNQFRNVLDVRDWINSLVLNIEELDIECICNCIMMKLV